MPCAIAASEGSVGAARRVRRRRAGLAVAPLTLILVAGVPGARARAQEPVTAAHAAVRARLDHALVENRADAYDSALVAIDEGLRQRPDDAVLLHYRGFTLYRKGSLLAAAQAPARTVKPLFEDADRTLERSAAALPWAETFAVRAVVQGQLLGFANPLSAVRMGARISRLLDRAAEAGPDNPRVWMLRGVATLFKPGFVGGGAGNAERELRRALALFPPDAPPPPRPWWGHAEAWGWLGQALAKQGKPDEARRAYARALELQPGNRWVREALLPALDAR